MKCRRLLLADRHFGVLEGSQCLLRDLFGSIVMVADEQSLMEAASGLRPDLVIMDLSLAGRQEARLAERLLECHPGLRLVVLSVHEEASVADRLMAAGVAGFVVKRAVGTDLLPAVRRVLDGGTYVSPTVHAG
jgi:DNA-binding NarL/FixJ family response regulator